MRIRRRIVEQLIGHAKKESPLEACGYLASEGGIITASYALRNIDKSGEHFSFDPKEQFSAVRDARAKGLEICAVYHSHLASPARPSQEDIRLANDPRMIYVIVSLAQSREDIKAFRIKDKSVEPEALEVLDNGMV